MTGVNVAEARFAAAVFVDGDDIYGKDFVPVVLYATIWERVKVFGGKVVQFAKAQHKLLKAVVNGGTAVAGAAGAGPVGAAVGKLLGGLLSALLSKEDEDESTNEPITPMFTIDPKAKFGVVLQYVQEWRTACDEHAGKDVLTYVKINRCVAFGPGELRTACLKESSRSSQSSNSANTSEAQSSAGKTSGQQVVNNTLQAAQKLLGEQAGTMRIRSSTDATGGGGSFSSLFFNANFLKSSSTVTGAVDEFGKVVSDASLVSAVQEAISNATTSAVNAAHNAALSGQAQELSVAHEFNQWSIQGNPSLSNGITLRYWQVQQLMTEHLIVKAITPAILLRVIPANEKGDVANLSEGDQTSVRALEQCLKSHKLLLHVKHKDKPAKAGNPAVGQYLAKEHPDKAQKQIGRLMQQLLEDEQEQQNTKQDGQQPQPTHDVKAYPLWSLIDERPIDRLGEDEFYFSLVLPGETQQAADFKAWAEKQLSGIGGPLHGTSAIAASSSSAAHPARGRGGMLVSKRTFSLPVGEMVEMLVDGTTLPGPLHAHPAATHDSAATVASGGPSAAAAGVVPDRLALTAMSLPSAAGFPGGLAGSQQPTLPGAFPQLGGGAAAAAGMQASGTVGAAAMTASAVVDQGNSQKWGQAAAAGAQMVGAAAGVPTS